MKIIEIQLNSGERLKALQLESIDYNEKKIIASWKRVLGEPKRLALKLYSILLNSKSILFTEELAQKIDEPIYNVRRALKDLETLQLIKRIRKKRRRALADSWTINKSILSFFQIIPLKKFGAAEKTLVNNQNNNISQKFTKLSSLFVRYSGLPWILDKIINWNIQRNGLMDYQEIRKYFKLSSILPDLQYSTLCSEIDNYSLNIRKGNNEKLEFNLDIYKHKAGKLNIINAIIDPEQIKAEYQMLPLGSVFEIIFCDQKRIYACTSTKKRFFACFPYDIKTNKINDLKINYKISQFTNPINCEIWFDSRKIINLNNFQDELKVKNDSMSYSIKILEGNIIFHWEGKYLMTQANLIKFLFVFKPEYKSDYSKWIHLYQAENCPFCHRIPYELIKTT